MHAEPALAHIQPGARASASFAFIPAYLRAFALKAFLLPEQARNRRMGKASKQASGTQSFTECTQSFTERRQMALRARHLDRSNSPPRETP